MKNHGKALIGLGLVGCLSTAAIYFLANHGRTAMAVHPLESSEERLPLAESPVTGEVLSRSRPATVAAATQRGTDRARGLPEKLAGSKSAAEINRQMSERWLGSVATYQGDDRAKVLDDLEDSLVRMGPGVVFELKRSLERLNPYQTTERAATFHALGRVGKTLLDSKDPDAASALATIQSVAKEELALPTYLAPDPDLHTETMAPAELHSALHLGVIDEKDGELFQPTLVSKLAAIQMLAAVGDAAALQQLQTLQQQPDNPVGIQFVVEHAIALVSHK